MHKTLLLCFIHGFKVNPLLYEYLLGSLSPLENRAVMTPSADSQVRGFGLVTSYSAFYSMDHEISLAGGKPFPRPIEPYRLVLKVDYF